MNLFEVIRKFKYILGFCHVDNLLLLLGFLHRLPMRYVQRSNKLGFIIIHWKTPFGTTGKFQRLLKPQLFPPVINMNTGFHYLQHCNGSQVGCF